MLLATLFLAALAALIGPAGRSAADDRRSALTAIARTGHLEL